MDVRRAAPHDLAEVRELYHKSRHLFINCGSEDLPKLLTQPLAAVAPAAGPLQSVVLLQQEERSQALSAEAPTRVSLRLALSNHAASPIETLPQLFQATFEHLDTRDHPKLAYALTDENWLQRVLEDCGYRQTDSIRFYRRSRAQTPNSNGPANLRPLQEEDLAELARLDALAFDPLWHMGEAELLHLLFSCRIQVAMLDAKIVGYTALSFHPSSGLGPSIAHLVRIAVHPDVRRKGIGRQLLSDAIAYAHRQEVREIQLNTQETNSISQRLYESFDFRPQGRSLPVLTRLFPRRSVQSESKEPA